MSAAIIIGIVLGAYAAYLRATRRVIYVGTNPNPYLIRYFLTPPTPWGRLYLHRILQDDDERAMHDHPWMFYSLILWRGYWEWYYDGDGRKLVHRVRFGQFIKRDALWRHRLELINGKPATTLVWRGPTTRRWGFWIDPRTWCYWRRYDHVNGRCDG